MDGLVFAFCYHFPTQFGNRKDGLQFALHHRSYANLPRLTASEQREFASRMERKQMKEFMTVRCL